MEQQYLSDVVDLLTADTLSEVREVCEVCEPLTKNPLAPAFGHPIPSWTSGTDRLARRERRVGASHAR